MQIKYNAIPKKDVKVCTEDYTIQEALEVLEETGFRCIPVLDKDNKKFMGNIYKSRIYEYMVKNAGPITDSIMKLIRDEDIVTYEDSSFFKIFFTIKKYPYVAVLKENGDFSGILTHANVMSLLEDSWGVKTGSYALTISTHEYQGALKNIVTIIKKYCNIQSLLTLDNESTFLRRVIVTLPKDTTEKQFHEIVQKLEREGFRVFDIEKF
ncbi:CBS domain-containing protein [Anaerobacillus alkaliphilus]|uniref:CBS domain-containing protein n=1 Tax=Anaerobacillus alkaliphilus TaxID=1548597 RepID=A0A4Q0VWZ3_9BACI|nr:cyclic di-AMP binding protein CbpA [Anaerobacillus alkaliphilus]RXJ03999.1 CBS domain-containing protein [Anaerobacillus alkaliphilus]